MTYPTREHEELLRRALRVAADSVEPAGDGLERIRARLTTPRPAVAAWMMSGTEPAVLRMRPLLTRLRQVSESALDRLWAGRSALDRLWAGRSALDRLWAGRGALRAHLALRAHPAWLRPAAAMAAFVVIIGSGALAIRALQHTITQTGVPTSLGVAEGISSGQPGGGLNGQGQKLIQPVQTVPLVPLDPSMPQFWPLLTPTGTPPPQTPQTTPVASPSCTPTVTNSQSPSPSGSPSPSSASPSPTTSPTSTATSTGSPTPTTSPTDSPGASSAGASSAGASSAGASSAGAVTQAVEAAPLSSGAGSTSGSPSPGVRTGTC